MKTIENEADLDQAILQLQARSDIELNELRDQVRQTAESFRPVNILNRFIADSLESPILKGDLVNSVIGLAAGFVSKKMFLGLSGTPVKNVMGSFIMSGVSRFVTQNPEIIKSIGKKLWDLFAGKKPIENHQPVQNEETE